MARIQAQQPDDPERNKLKLPIPEPAKPQQKQPSTAMTRLKKVQAKNMESRYDSLSYDEKTGALTVVLTGASLLGLNVMLRVFDAKTTGLKKTWQKRIEALRLENRSTFAAWKGAATWPVYVEEVYVTTENLLLDNESVAAACKPIIDACVRSGFLPDDDPSHLAHPVPFTVRGKEGGLILRFVPCKEYGLISKEALELATTLGLRFRSPPT